MPVDKRSIEVAMARSFRDSELEASVASVLVLILVILSPAGHYMPIELLSKIRIYCTTASAVILLQ